MAVCLCFTKQFGNVIQSYKDEYVLGCSFLISLLEFSFPLSCQSVNVFFFFSKH